MYRYAIYYVPPPGTALAAFGARWLGRDAPDLTGVSAEDWRRAVAAPRRYGFHATLKAPFRLAAGTDERALADAVERFRRTRGPASVGKLALRVLADFLAFAPMERGAAAELAADCVRAFDEFRAPLTAEESARRRPDGLTASERANLDRWGYPYVMEDYRFHLTLTGPLDEAGRARFGAAIARAALPAIAEPVEIADICLCGQKTPEAEFGVLGRFALEGPPQR
ncbi:MAG: DUF1045 domain-containing protein [Defluviicoccus sp.]|nr:DUF1045 domain-containing protein [Defluviicoccus sp.]MDE0274822.1 DUF1045 domain-containing protein [Defluviicoccus sp.]